VATDGHLILRERANARGSRRGDYDRALEGQKTNRNMVVSPVRKRMEMWIADTGGCGRKA